MLVVRQDQMDALAEFQAREFEKRMLHNLGVKFPRQCAKLGEPTVREMIREGVARSASYDITAERDVSRFIELMFIIRRDFDRAEETAWSRPMLEDRAFEPDARLRKVYWIARRKGQAPGLPAGVSS